jgi:biopolymer transport protein ExbB/TolQ
MSDRGNKAGSSSTSTKIGVFSILLVSPVLWGSAFCAGFYQAIPYIPVQDNLLDRYFCSHPLEYVTTGLFFIGVTILLFKALGLGKERSVFQYSAGLFEGVESIDVDEPLDRVVKIEAEISYLKPKFQNTYFVRRVRDIASLIHSRKTTEKLEDQLKYLAELASEKMHDSYALVRTIIWAVPILGFLGTVIGITLAIANVTPDQLESGLDSVTGGLAVAFDTTALALTLSLLLVFCSFIVEQSESKILSQVEEFGSKYLTGLFPSESRFMANSPLLEAEKKAADVLIKKTEAMINKQTDLWQSSLEDLRHRWTRTLTWQTSQLDESLRKGLVSTLDNHKEELTGMRSEFMNALENTTSSFDLSLAENRMMQQEIQQKYSNEMTGLWGRVHTDLKALSEQQQGRNQGLWQDFALQLNQWQSQLSQTVDAEMKQLGELNRQSDMLSKILEGEGNLSRLQEKLSDNLDSVRSTENFENTMHSLTAAVHLLTARASNTKAA